jgi:hypothetical protein
VYLAAIASSFPSWSRESMSSWQAMLILRMLLLPTPMLELLVMWASVKKPFKSLVNDDVLRPKHFHVCVLVFPLVSCF